MKPGLRRFSPDDLAVLRICRRNGWSIERQWDHLSGWEQEMWLAHDAWTGKALEHIREALIDQDKYTIEAFVALALARL